VVISVRGRYKLKHRFLNNQKVPVLDAESQLGHFVDIDGV
jgi:hypothetical protein